eukprot:Gb_14463 [translate_table: standard]
MHPSINSMASHLKHGLKLRAEQIIPLLSQKAHFWHRLSAMSSTPPYLAPSRQTSCHPLEFQPFHAFLLLHIHLGESYSGTH